MLSLCCILLHSNFVAIFQIYRFMKCFRSKIKTFCLHPCPNLWCIKMALYQCFSQFVMPFFVNKGCLAITYSSFSRHLIWDDGTLHMRRHESSREMTRHFYCKDMPIIYRFMCFYLEFCTLFSWDPYRTDVIRMVTYG